MNWWQAIGLAVAGRMLTKQRHQPTCRYIHRWWWCQYIITCHIVLEWRVDWTQLGCNTFWSGLNIAWSNGNGPDEWGCSGLLGFDCSAINSIQSALLNIFLLNEELNSRRVLSHNPRFTPGNIQCSLKFEIWSPNTCNDCAPQFYQFVNERMAKTLQNMVILFSLQLWTYILYGYIWFPTNFRIPCFPTQNGPILANGITCRHVT